jgi:uncharacterized membrane protein
LADAKVKLTKPQLNNCTLCKECLMMTKTAPKTIALAASALALALPLLAASSTGASAKSCSELRSLCWTMRDNKNDCAKPYQRCLSSGTFITPLGRVFRATR